MEWDAAKEIHPTLPPFPKAGLRYLGHCSGSQKVLADPVVQVPYVRPGYVSYRAAKKPLKPSGKMAGVPRNRVLLHCQLVYVFYIFSLPVCLLSQSTCHSTCHSSESLLVFL